MAAQNRNRSRRHYDAHLQGPGLSHPPAAAQLPRGRQGQERDAGQPVAPARCADRDHPRARCRARPSCRWPQAFEITRSRPHGHVQAVACAMAAAGFGLAAGLQALRASATWCWRWSPRASSRPHTKLATTRWWHTTTLAEDFGVADANEDDLYAAMDWLLARQDRDPEETRRAPSAAKAAWCCTTCRRATSRAAPARWPSSATTAMARSGMLQVNYGLLTDARGCPVAVSVHEGNVADSTDLPARRSRSCARTSASSRW